MAEPKYEVVWPLGKSAYEVAAPAKQAADLRGKTVCEVWEELFRGEEMFPILRELLSKRYPGVKFVDYNVFGNPHAANEKEVVTALPGLLRQHGCDVVISGVGA